MIAKTVEDAKALTAEKSTVALKRATTSAALEEGINNIRGAVMIVYPMGLPDYDHVRQILEEREILEGAEGLDVLEVERSSLWAFSKEMQTDKLLSDYVGKNEKTKVVVKLQKKGAGAPGREPVVSEDEQKAMIAFYHKKEQVRVTPAYAEACLTHASHASHPSEPLPTLAASHPYEPLSTCAIGVDASPAHLPSLAGDAADEP